MYETEPLAAPLAAGQQLEAGVQLEGRFRIVQMLGQGGMGEVYEAVDVALGTRVAVKTVRLEQAANENALHRFRREILLARKIAHPNVCKVFELHVGGFGEPPLFLSMELLEGETLAQRLRKEGRLDEGVARGIVLQIASALGAAHAEGVVHRDLKASNVMLVPDHGGGERAVVTDFGIAHAAGALSDATATLEGPLGTPAYMAPEQVTGGAVTPATDFYCLGVLMYELTTGTLPFTGESPREIAYRRLGAEAPDPRASTPALSKRWGKVVRWCLASDPAQRPQTAEALRQALEGKARPPRRLSRRGLVAMGLAVSAAVSVVPLVARLRSPRAAAALTAQPVAAVQATGTAELASAPAALPSVAVLPFADLSPGKDQEYFADGVAEEILSALSHVEGLRVVGRTSSFSFKGKSVQIQEIGRQLNVRAVLEGSVRREGDRVRVTAQVVNVADGYHVWSASYSRQITGIFEVQDDIAQAVVEALKVKLVPGKGPGGGEGRATNPDSYSYYLMGLHHERQGTLEGIRRARTALEKALALDPGNAPAQAALAIAIFNVWAWGGTSTAAEVEDVRRQSLAAAERAVALAPSLADGYAARGFLRGAYFDWAGSRADLDRALALRPSDSHALNYLGEWMSVFGRVTESIALTRRALELDPLWERPLSRLCHLYLASGELSLARSAIDHWLEINPDNAAARSMQVLLHLLEGNPEAALSAAQRFTRPRARLWGIALAENDLGHAAESNQALEELTSKFTGAYPHQIAQVYAWRGDADHAFEWLERAWRERDSNIGRIKFDPLLRKIRGDPRYPTLLKKMNLPVD